jgi:predicted transcriptional regulator
MQENKADIRRLAVDVVIAFLSQNRASGCEIPDLIKSIYAVFAELEKGPAQLTAGGRQKPALPISQSIKPDHVTCIECGKKLRSLKFHLSRSHNMTPATYRAKWELPADYPMSALEFSASKSVRAIKIGFGHRRKG